MKKGLRILLTAIVLIGLFVLYIFTTTGYFRTIENTMQGTILKKINIAGVEDITVDEDDGFAILSAFDRASFLNGNPKEGGIYMMDLTTTEFAVTLLSANVDIKLAPHGISLIQLDSMRHRLLVANHAEGEQIEVFDLFHKDSLVHVKTLEDELIYAINDIVAVSENEFYFTNDHYHQNGLGRIAEDYLGLAKCESVYFNGQDYQVVDNTLAYANGINYDAKRNFMYIASPRGFKIKVFIRLDDGTLEYYDTIATGTGIDNLEFDEEGNIWSGAHPNLLAFSAYAKGKKPKAPSEVIKIEYRSKGDYTIETTFLDDGTKVSASSVAAPYKNLVLVGNVMDDHFLILKE